MRNQYKPRIVVSVDRADLSQGENSASYIQFKQALDLGMVNYIQCKGTYNGVQERSFILNDDKRGRSIALGAMAYYGQESVLFIDNEGTGKLLFSDETEKVIGRLNVTTQRPVGDHTYIPSLNEYFTFS